MNMELKIYVSPSCEVHNFSSEQFLATSPTVGFDISIEPPVADDDDTDLVGETRKHVTERDFWSD